ncbi:MAG: DoxX family protein [Myxococcota bacterium]
MPVAKRIALWALAAFMVAIGTTHFLRPEPFVEIVPPFLPAPLTLVYVSGACEILGGLGVLYPATRRIAAWGLIALYVAVFPANIYMAVENVPIGGVQPPPWALWARLPLQLVFIAWAWWFTRPTETGTRTGTR